MQHKEYYIEDEDNVPEELLQAYKDKKPIQLLSCIGWIDVSYPEFKVDLTYRVVVE